MPPPQLQLLPCLRLLLQPSTLSSAPAVSSSLLYNQKLGLSSAAMATDQKPPPPPPPPAGGVAERIMPHLLNIYGSCATARDFEIYAADATFEDPLMRAHGVKQIKSAFYTLPKLFGESKIVEYTVQENPMGPGKTEILIDNKQHYKLLGKPVDLTTLIRLQVHDGKVVNHQDWWNKKPLKNRETVDFPMVGRIAEATRRGAMLLTHAFMGFGKDPPTSSS